MSSQRTNCARDALSALVLSMLTLGATTSWAAPHGTRITYFDDPSTTMAISWNSNDAADDQIVYGTSPMALGTMATADDVFVQPAPLGNAFTKRLTGLMPNTTYYYRVGGPGGLHPAAASPPFSFHTHSGDPCDPIRFILIGDNRADLDGIGPSDLWDDIMLEAMAHTPDFFVNTGDMVKNGDDPDEWAGFIDASEPGWALIPSILTMGNHDEDSVNGNAALYNQLYEHPFNSMSNTEDYYSIDIGPIHFVSLNTQFLGGSELSSMLAWLDADLAATTQPWKIAFFHKAVYSRGNHSSGEESTGVLNASFIPIFDTYDVDLVFNGHSHNYERYAPSVGVDMAFGGGGRSFPAGNASTLPPGPIPDGATGTTYMVSGGAGALTTDVFGFTCLDAACCLCIPCTPWTNSCDAEVYGNDTAGNTTYDGQHGFVIFDIMADTLTATAWSTNAGNTNPAAIVDSFSMIDSAFTPTCTPTGTDAGVPGSDSGVPGTDAGGPGSDATIPGTDGATPGTDMGSGVGTDAGNGGGRGGCNCSVPAGVGGAGPLPFAVAILLFGLAVRRRQR